MTSETRSLHYEVLQILKKAHVPYDPLLPIRIKTISAVNRLHTADRAFIGIAIFPGRCNVLLRPKTLLVETLRLDRQSFITTWSIVVMDAAGDLRLVEEITANDTEPSSANHFVDQVADLIDEQATYNHPPLPTTPETIDILHTTARQIASNLKPTWAGWVTFLLKLLEQHTLPQYYDEMLTEIALAIEVRQLEGNW